MATFFDTAVPLAAYKVQSAADGGGLEWIGQTPSGEKRYDVEPATTWMLRTGIGMLPILPIDCVLKGPGPSTSRRTQ